MKDIVCSEDDNDTNEKVSVLTPDTIEIQNKVILKDYFLVMLQNNTTQLRKKANDKLKKEDPQWLRFKQEVTNKIANKLELIK